MERRGRASAPAAGTILNALATGIGGTFAIDRDVTATVTLAGNADDHEVRGEIDGVPDADTRLIERCVSLTTEAFGNGEGGTVRTESAVPMAAGLKSSSAAANAAVLATIDALGLGLDGRDEDVSTAAAIDLAVRAARDVGVTTTGCTAGAISSMRGGVALANNATDELLAREPVEWNVLVWVPAEQAFSADADVARCRRVAPVAEVAADLALGGEYGRAMTINGFAFCATLSFPTDPLVDALPDARGVTLSGTGSSYTAIGDRATLSELRETWNEREGRTWLTRTRTRGARIG